MPPRSKFARPVANRVFTDRERPIEQFNAARRDLQPGRHRILSFYGVGGQGKTALCRRLRQQLASEDPQQNLRGHLDLDEVPFREPARGLLQLRKTLRASGRIRFAAFDVAVATYWEKSYPTEDPRRALKDLLTDSEGLLAPITDNAPDWLDLAEQLPAGLGLGVKALNYTRRKLKEWGAKRTVEALKGLELLDSPQLLAKLPYFMGIDLCVHSDRPNALAPVIFIDTYEALWSDRPDKIGLAAIETDAWIRELVAASPGVLFVIFGRDKLTWDQRFPDDWAGYLDDRHLLGGLSDGDADQFLRAIPIDDPALRRAIIAGSKGVDEPWEAEQDPAASGAHPFFLDLAVDTYLDLVTEGRTPAPEDFGATRPEILARFLRHRGIEERETLKVLAAPRAFDRELFAALVERFGTRYPLTAFPDFVEFSFIEGGADGHYRLHGLMRDHLYAELDDQTRADLEGFLFAWFDARCRVDSPRELTSAHEGALVEAVHHRATDDPEAALAWFWERTGIYDDAARYKTLEPLYRRALAIHEASVGPEHPDVAIGLNNLAGLLQATNRLGEAEPLYRRALAIHEASFGPEHPNVAIGLNNLAGLLQATNRLGEAEPLHRRALAIDEASFGPEHPNVATSLNNLAQLLQATNRLGEAEPLMRRALAIDEASFGPEHPNVAIGLNNLAGLLQATNRLGEAEPLYRRALAIHEASVGPEHPDVAIGLNNLAGLLQATNRLGEAEPLYRRALAIHEASVGPEHPEVALILNDLAVLLRATNRLGEAEPLYRRTLAIYEASFGPEHPNVATSLNNLAGLLAGHQSPGGGRAPDAPGARHLRGELRARASRRRHRSQQPGRAPPGRQPPGGGRAPVPPGAADLARLHQRHRAPPSSPGGRAPQLLGAA